MRSQTTSLTMKLHRFLLPLTHPFTISRETITEQPTLIVELQQDGLSGYGESTTNEYYGHTLESISTSLENVRYEVESQPLQQPEKMWEQLNETLQHDRFAQNALDQAAWDLWGKQQGQPLHQLWNLSAEQSPSSSYSIGIDTIEKMVSKMNEFPDWSYYKIKLGTSNDLEILRALRQETSATFRVDANCGWSAEETIQNAKAMQELDVEFIEQPLPRDRWNEMKDVAKESLLPLIADESCCEEEDVSRCIDHFHGINIKLIKCGGLTPARRMIKQARQADLKLMAGCMLESSVGISAPAQLLPLLDYADLDGAILLKEDIATGVTFKNGQVCFPNINGTGVTLTAKD
ncbi:Muconate cycloisomerase [hydrothermal vent metagenome]|uniref:Muconate cycloisomerase n=1 Tax=hydrothermal vent metagenome TaxID=652676 RepID=A0A3B1E252_9ZZZZ